MTYTIDHIIGIIETGRPKSRRRVKFPCEICNKTVKSNQKAVQCDLCDLWVHIDCNGLLEEEYENLKYDHDLWYCLICNLKNNLVNVPFTRCDNNKLININNTSSMSFLESLPNVEIVNETSKFSNMAYNEVNIELPIKSTGKYYLVKDFLHLNKSRNNHTPSKSSKGGTTIYVNKDFDSLERSDLDINVIAFESTWIEIKNKSKNIIIGCLYRHPQ